MEGTHFLVLAAAVIIGIIFIRQFHPEYVRQRATFAERHQHFDDDVLGLEHQIGRADSLATTFEIDLKIHMFQRDHERYISPAELGDAVNHLKGLLIERETFLRNKYGLYAI